MSTMTIIITKNGTVHQHCSPDLLAYQEKCRNPLLGLAIERKYGKKLKSSNNLLVHTGAAETLHLVL